MFCLVLVQNIKITSTTEVMYKLHLTLYKKIVQYK